MEFIITTILLSVLIILGLVIAFKKNKVEFGGSNEQLVSMLNEKNKNDLENLYNLIKQLNSNQMDLIKLYNDSVVNNVKNLIENNQQNLKIIAEKLSDLSSVNEKQMDKLVMETRENLKQINENSSKKLDEMRVIVDEKLNATLSDRLNKSFSLVSEQLQAVTKGLGEMQNLASGVGDLKKVLTNVKTRGTFGEVQLGVLLEQMLAPNQYMEQVMLKDNSTERVDFVITLPGKDDKNILLPIDAKFPIEDYLRLVDATEISSQDEILTLQKQLVKRVKEQAKSIHDKYIIVPKTTDFAIMYLPTEGLYSEVIKQNGLFELLQRDYHITVCGPTTLSALLNSLQMGFKTLAIEKRSSEIWTMLATFKKEFTTYVELLSKTQKKLTEATDTIESATKKSEKIQKQLDKVSYFDDKDSGMIGE
ncbi:MAG: DNA recombination protein RmuC [Clostridiales bacterium]|nr:DNA recombination protein RmuC [Candidatus Apopatousia equi]